MKGEWKKMKGKWHQMTGSEQRAVSCGQRNHMLQGQSRTSPKHSEWPEASTFISWKVSFRREEMSGSMHPRIITEWLAEIDEAADMERIGQFRIHVREAPNGMRNSGFKDRLIFRRKHTGKTNVQCSRTGKLCFNCFCSHSIRQGHMMNLSDLFNVELCNDYV